MTATPLVPTGVVSLADYERLARERLPPAIWAYISGAGADGLTRRWNREAFHALKLEGLVFPDMRNASTATSLLGVDLDAPIILAPGAFQIVVVLLTVWQVTALVSAALHLRMVGRAVAAAVPAGLAAEVFGDADEPSRPSRERA